jgi:hypothetical protein
MNRYRGFCSQGGAIISSETCCATVIPTSTSSSYVSLPESIRIRNQLCTPYVYVPPGRGSSCSSLYNGGAVGATGTAGTTGTTGAAGTNAAIPGQPVYIDAAILVRTVAASETTALLAAQTLNAATDATNPDTRFAQYFPEQPPAPMSKICPERYPNPARVRDRFCIPQGTFAPSVPPS